MAERWYVFSGRESGGLVETAVEALCPGADVVREASEEALRERLLSTTPGRASAAVGPGCREVDPVNLAAAIACDGHAREVLLVVDVASGSLRSRAARAGVARVLDRVEAERAVGGLRPRGREALAADDAGPIDDPDEVLPAAQRDPSPRHLLAGEASGRAPRVDRREGAAPVIAVASGRGGVGKSSLVATMACVAASWGLRVGVVDLDLCSGNLGGYLGLSEIAALDALDGMTQAGEADIAGLGRPAGEGVTLWGPCRLPEMAEVVSPFVGDVISTVANASDIVLVDTSTTWTDAVAEAVQSCDRLLLVGDERAGTVSSLSRVAALAVRLGVARTRIARATNRLDPHRREEPFLFRADVGLETARSFSVLEGGDEVAECLSAGQAAQLAQGTGEYAASVGSLLAKLLEELGALPDDRRAHAARDREVGKRQRGLFARMREAS